MNKSAMKNTSRILLIVFSLNAALVIRINAGQTFKERFLKLDKYFQSIYNEMQDTFLGRTFIRYGSQLGLTAATLLMMHVFVKTIQENQTSALLTHKIQPITVTDVTLKDYIGVPQEVAILIDQIKNREQYKKLKASFTKGILLTGNPGTGKSFLARAIAGETQCPFFSISATELTQPFVGMSSVFIRNLFKNAKIAAMKSPSKVAIIFIDEIDAIGGRGATFTGGISVGVLETLLTEMDGFNTMSLSDLDIPFYQKAIRFIKRELIIPDINVVILAATNIPEKIDPALKRPGRFDSIIEVKNPDLSAREKIIELYIKQYPCSDDILVHKLARATEGMTPAAIKTMFQSASREAASQKQEKIEIKNLVKAIITIKQTQEKSGDDVLKHVLHLEQNDSPDEDKKKIVKVLIALYPFDSQVSAEDLLNSDIVKMTNEQIIEFFENIYQIKCKKEKMKNCMITKGDIGSHF